jgi:hypothetical protein
MAVRTTEIWGDFGEGLQVRNLPQGYTLEIDGEIRRLYYEPLGYEPPEMGTKKLIASFDPSVRDEDIYLIACQYFALRNDRPKVEYVN